MKLKLHDKVKALDAMAKYLKMGMVDEATPADYDLDKALGLVSGREEAEPDDE